MKHIDLVAAGLMLFGNIVLINERSWLSFVVFLKANLLYLTHWLRYRQYPTAILCCVFIAQNIWGILTWR